MVKVKAKIDTSTIILWYNEKGSLLEGDISLVLSVSESPLLL